MKLNDYYYSINNLNRVLQQADSHYCEEDSILAAASSTSSNICKMIK